MIIKKTTLIFASIVLCVCIIGGVFVCNAYSKHLWTASNEINSISSSGNGLPTVIIDAGHGGEDGGTSDAQGNMEKDVNLLIASKLATMINSSGYPVVMTRDEDTAIYDDESSSLREKKVSDMNNRLEIFNSSDDNIVISIHQNFFTQEKYNGTQIFYSPNNPESASLAESTRVAVTSLLQPDNTRETKMANDDIFLLNNATVPAIIVECGFLSNSEEAALLQTEVYQQNMAFSIFCGFLQYVNS